MTRLTGEQLNVIKEKLGVDRIWSFSKMSTYEQCTWLYKLKYIDKLRGIQDSCYTYWGTIAHDIRQGFYEGDYKSNDEMLEKLEEEIAKYILEDKKELKFPNQNEAGNYFDNLRHYFKNCKHVEGKVENERVVLSVLNGEDGKKYAFQGYIDSFYQEDGKNIILDYKTSSMSGFTGDKLLDKSKQLMIYAYGLWKMQNLPIESIVLRFDMMKYCNITFKQKNGNYKTTRAERRAWVSSIANQVRKDLEDVPKSIEAIEKKIAQLIKKRSAKCRTELEIEGLNVQIGDYEQEKKELETKLFDVFEINEMVSEAIDTNDLESLPQFVQDKYKVEDCLIDVELNEEIIDGYIESMKVTLEEIVENECGDAEETFGRNRIQDSESYYCNNLCDLRDSCKFYKDYKDHLSMFLNSDKKEENEDDLILQMLGL